jgi:Flp pilus assembly pilin Flp
VRIGLSRFWSNREGVTSIEYAIVAAVVSVAIIAALEVLSDDVGDKWDFVAQSVTNSSQ